MATSLLNLSRKVLTNALCANAKANKQLLTAPSRNISTVGESISGPIPARPLRNKASVPKVSLFLFVGIYVGQYLAKSFAAFMEETELFVPDDDDD